MEPLEQQASLLVSLVRPSSAEEREEEWVWQVVMGRAESLV